MLFQLDPTISSMGLLGFLIFLMILMIVCYMKIRVFPIMVGLYVFSLVIFTVSLGVELPLNPYIQIMFIIIQTLFFTAYAFDWGKPRYKERYV